jgi:hypothetical protein
VIAVPIPHKHPAQYSLSRYESKGCAWRARDEAEGRVGEVPPRLIAKVGMAVAFPPTKPPLASTAGVPLFKRSILSLGFGTPSGR